MYLKRKIDEYLLEWKKQEEITGESYEDIQWGIKLADSNVGVENDIWTFPYFCSFLIKRYLNERT